MTRNDPGTRTGAAAIALAIAAATFAAYWPAIHGAWIWDDRLEIVDNPNVRAAAGWWRAWVNPEGMDYFPVKGTAQWAEWHLWGDLTAGYHMANVALHVVASLLAWRLFARLGIRFGWVGAAVIALHPLAVESVAWMAEFKNELSLVFLLVAADGYVASEQGGPRRTYALALVAFILALLSKSTVVMFPVACLCYDLWARGRIGRRDLARAAPFFLASLVLGLVTVTFQASRAIGRAGPMPGLHDRMGQAGWSLLAYLGHAVFPWRLSPIYLPIAADWPVIVPWVLLGLIAAALWIAGGVWRRHGLIALAVFSALLAPVLGLLPMSYLRVAPRADHLEYLGLIALGAVASGMAGLLANFSRRLAAFAIGCVLVACFAETRSLAAIFTGPRALWSAAVERSPGSWLAAANLGKVALDEGRYADAAALLDRAEELRPDSAEVRLDRGNAYKHLGRPSVAGAEYRRAVALDPAFPGAYYDLGVLLLEQEDAAGASRALEAALRLDAGNAAAHNDLGLALGRMGNADGAAVEFSEAIRLDPGNKEAHLNLGNLLARRGEAEPAIGQYRLALAIDPAYAAAKANLAAVLRAYGRPPPNDGVPASRP
jgi:tetratricopeptide (TPR) repeat protein